MKRLFPLALLALSLVGCGKKDSDSNKPAAATKLYSLSLNCDASNTRNVPMTIAVASSKDRVGFGLGINPNAPIRRDLGVFSSTDTVRVSINTGVRAGLWPAAAGVSARIMVDGTEKARCVLPSATTTYDHNGFIYTAVTLDLSKL